MAHKADAQQIAKDFVQACRGLGIPISKAFLFGSYARGTADRHSDIDVVLVSEAFGSNIVRNAGLTARVNWQFPLVEVHHYNPAEFEEATPLVNEIKATGIRVD